METWSKVRDNSTDQDTDQDMVLVKAQIQIQIKSYFFFSFYPIFKFVSVLSDDVKYGIKSSGHDPRILLVFVSNHGEGLS